MSFMSKIARPQAGATLERLIREVYGGSKTASGASVNEDSAMRVGAVYACIQVLSQSVAQLPLHMYQFDGKSKKKAVDHYLYPIVHDEPNGWMTSYQFKQLTMVTLLLRGNSIWLKTGVPGSSKIRELIPIHPDLVQEILQDKFYKLWYKVKRPGSAAIDTIPQEKVIHFRGLSTNGYAGLNPIEQAREMIGLSMSAETHGAKVFANGAKMGGLLYHPGKLSETAYNRLIESFNDTWRDMENAHKTGLLEEGMKWEKITMTNEDAQFLDSRKYQRSEIAGFFRVPAHLINDLGDASYNNIELLDLAFVKHSLTPWLINIEQTLKMQTMTPQDKLSYYYKFNADGLLRGDIKSRYEAYGHGILNGYLNPNEVRDKEDMNPYDGGDEYRAPLNTEPVGGTNEPS